MGKISTRQIQHMLDNASNKTEAIKKVMSLLWKNGYKNLGNANRLLFVYSPINDSTHTVDIDLTKYADEQVREYELKERNVRKERREIYKLEERNRLNEEAERKNAPKKETEKAYSSYSKPISGTDTPLIKALKYSSWIPLFVTTVGILAILTGDRILQEVIQLIIGSIIYLAIPVFLVLWLLFYIKDWNTTSKIKEKIHSTASNIKWDLQKKEKPNDYSDIADTLLKCHKLLEAGSISQKEFNDIKRGLLSKRS